MLSYTLARGVTAIALRDDDDLVVVFPRGADRVSGLPIFELNIIVVVVVVV